MRTTVFICYSHSDGKFRSELQKQLLPCSDAVEVWTDQAIPAGVEWLPEIDRALAQVDAAVMIVSPDLLASSFVTAVEIPKILKRHQRGGMRPLWIHYRPAMFERTPLAALQCLHDPKRPLSTMRKADRETALVKIAKRICEPPPQRPMGNLLRAADEVFTAERGMVPWKRAQVGPDGIDMKVRGQRKTEPFVTADELAARLGPQERKVLRSYEQSMDALLRQWSRLYPRVEATGGEGTRELTAVRAKLAQEFDKALGFIEKLGYQLDDHYLAVREVVQPGLYKSVQAAPAPRASLGIRLVLDGKQRPQWSGKENGYWLQAWVNDAPERVQSVVWHMHPSISPSRETMDAPPEFRKDFVAHGDFTLRADLRSKTRTVIRRLDTTLAEALRREYPGKQSKPLQDAIDDIAQH